MLLRFRQEWPENAALAAAAESQQSKCTPSMAATCPGIPTPVILSFLPPYVNFTRIRLAVASRGLLTMPTSKLGGGLRSECFLRPRAAGFRVQWVACSSFMGRKDTGPAPSEQDQPDVCRTEISGKFLGGLTRARTATKLKSSRHRCGVPVATTKVRTRESEPPSFCTAGHFRGCAKRSGMPIFSGFPSLLLA